MYNTMVINHSNNIKGSEWPTWWYCLISTSLMASSFRPLRLASLIPWYLVDKTNAWKKHQVCYQDMERLQGVETINKQINHLWQQFFLLRIQPSDKNIRALKLVHHVCWFEVVGLGEVVSPCNSNPNGFISVLLNFDWHLSYNIKQWLVYNVCNKRVSVNDTTDAGTSRTYHTYKLTEVRFKLLFELSQLHRMSVIFKTEKHRERHLTEHKWDVGEIKFYHNYKLCFSTDLKYHLAPGAGRHATFSGLDCQWYL